MAVGQERSHDNFGAKHETSGLGARLNSVLRRYASTLSMTPVHPQWFSFVAKGRAADVVSGAAKGVFLDIGCAGGSMRGRVADRCRYIGLDYPPTGEGLYRTRPDVFCSAALLPIKASTVDTAALLDVLEHLPEPRDSLREIRRVLRPGGMLYVSVPCMYPLHDEPYDYQRPTVHGLRHWLRSAGFDVLEIQRQGTPVETAALLLNIALARMLTRAIRRFAPFVALSVPIAPLIVLINAAAWIVGRYDRGDSMMPFAYQVVARRPVESADE